MSWKKVVGLIVAFSLLGLTCVSAYEMTPERKAWLATNPYKGVTVRILTLKATVSQPLFILGRKWEKETGGKVEVVEVPLAAFHQKIFTDLITGMGEYDAFLTASWYYGDYFSAVEPYIIPIEKFMKDPRFPQWDPDTVLPAIKKLLTWGGKWYGIPNDNDGQVLYYREDILTNPEYRKRFKAEFGYDLPVPPKTTDQFLDIAKFFNGWDWDKDGKVDYGLSMHLKVGEQAMFHYASWAACYVISPDNPYFWFNPENMEPLINSEGHLKAMEDMVEMVNYGPRAMLAWTLGEGWDLFLKGDAIFCFTWGDLGALAQDPKESRVKGKIGATPMPGRYEVYNPIKKVWKKYDKVIQVGNTTGGSWHPVISRYSKHPEATYDYCAFMAVKENAFWNFTRGWTGVDPGRTFAFLPPYGTASVEDYVEQGWDPHDVKPYTDAYYINFTNPLQILYLRIPGGEEYWRALDFALGKAASGELSPEEALDECYKDFVRITNRLGKERQLKLFRESVGYKG